jgi:hypothetical protein
MIRMARRIDSLSNSLAYLECIVSTRLKRITWLKRSPYGSSILRKNLFGTAELQLRRLWDKKNPPLQDAQEDDLLTRPTLAATSPARPESAKTASSPKDAPCTRQGRSSAADPRFTPHATRFTIPGSEARTPLADFFSILLEKRTGRPPSGGRPARLPGYGAD